MNNIVRIEAKRMYMKIIFVFANFIFFAITLFAEVRLPSILGNGMVLQQKTQTIYGDGRLHRRKLPLLHLGTIELIQGILLLTENGV